MIGFFPTFFGRVRRSKTKITFSTFFPQIQSILNNTELSGYPNHYLVVTFSGTAFSEAGVFPL